MSELLTVNISANGLLRDRAQLNRAVFEKGIALAWEVLQTHDTGRSRFEVFIARSR